MYPRIKAFKVAEMAFPEYAEKCPVVKDYKLPFSLISPKGFIDFYGIQLPLTQTEADSVLLTDSIMVFGSNGIHFLVAPIEAMFQPHLDTTDADSEPLKIWLHAQRSDKSKPYISSREYFEILLGAKTYKPRFWHHPLTIISQSTLTVLNSCSHMGNPKTIYRIKQGSEYCYLGGLPGKDNICSLRFFLNDFVPFEVVISVEEGSEKLLTQELLDVFITNVFNRTGYRNES